MKVTRLPQFVFAVTKNGNVVANTRVTTRDEARATRDALRATTRRSTFGLVKIPVIYGDPINSH
jgi:hypothetical protein